MSISLAIFKKKEHHHLSNSDSKMFYSASGHTRNSRFTDMVSSKMLIVNWCFGTENVVSLPKLLYAVLRFLRAAQKGGRDRGRKGERKEGRKYVTRLLNAEY